MLDRKCILLKYHRGHLISQHTCDVFIPNFGLGLYITNLYLYIAAVWSLIYFWKWLLFSYCFSDKNNYTKHNQ